MMVHIHLPTKALLTVRAAIRAGELCNVSRDVLVQRFLEFKCRCMLRAAESAGGSGRVASNVQVQVRLRPSYTWTLKTSIRANFGSVTPNLRSSCLVNDSFAAWVMSVTVSCVVLQFMRNTARD